jgi:hypothetical protein
MAYTSAKTKFREALPGVFDLQVASVEEIDGGLGLEEDNEEDQEFEF